MGQSKVCRHHGSYLNLSPFAVVQQKDCRFRGAIYYFIVMSIAVTDEEVEYGCID